MKYIYTATIGLWLIAIFCISVASLHAQPIPLSTAKEVRVRQGLPYFFDKLKGGKEVRIVYFGGSITEASNGWREQSAAWLQEKYPKAKITSINAAIGGTGSDLGAFRLKQHVLVHKPDMVFVEFAVNDSKKRPEDIYKAMEGIVRQIWQQNTTTDICFVYTLMADMAPVLQEGKFPLSASAMERIADYYHIPSIHMGLQIAAMEKKAQLIFKGTPEEHPGKVVFSADNVHPYPQTGHRLYYEALARSMQEMKKVSRRPARKLGKPFIANNWEQARMISVKEADYSPGWQALLPESDTVAKKLQNRFTHLIKASQPAEKITFRFKGTCFGLYDVMGPDCGQYAISVDGEPVKLYPRFDEFCTYYRANYFFIEELPDAIHTIELSVSAEKLDKAAILAKRNNTIVDSVKYSNHACYAGELMIIGQVLK
jgi:lysophospholipase L1-like esterase